MKGADPIAVLDFWWSAGAEKWFLRDEAFDKEIVRRFSRLHAAALSGKLDGWRDQPAAALALLILTDQFPRNMFRGSAKAFATDGHARETATIAVERGFDRAFPWPARGFFYLPFEHSEEMADQERAVDLFAAGGAAARENYLYALIHMDVIRRFGRFPHRNKALKRRTTAAEKAFLDSGGFSA